MEFSVTTIGVLHAVDKGFSVSANIIESVWTAEYTVDEYVFPTVCTV